MKIYLDLDGPILNPKQRYWLAHSKAVTTLGGTPYKDATHYWKQKQNFISKKIVLNECNIPIEKELEYINHYASFVESEELLTFDKLQPKAKNVLEILSQNNQLLLVSARSNEKNVLQQLKFLNIYQYFSEFLITSTRPGQNQDGEKTKLIKKEFKETQELGKVIVGDTNAEIKAAKELGIISITVLNGLRTKKFLKQFHPDYFISGINQLPDLLVKLTIEDRK